MKREVICVLSKENNIGKGVEAAYKKRKEDCWSQKMWAKSDKMLEKRVKKVFMTLQAVRSLFDLSVFLKCNRKSLKGFNQWCDVLQSNLHFKMLTFAPVWIVGGKTKGRKNT